MQKVSLSVGSPSRRLLASPRGSWFADVLVSSLVSRRLAWDELPAVRGGVPPALALRWASFLLGPSSFFGPTLCDLISPFPYLSPLGRNARFFCRCELPVISPLWFGFLQYYALPFRCLSGVVGWPGANLRSFYGVCQRWFCLGHNPLFLAPRDFPVVAFDFT